jgi:hypothetical protein
MKYDRSNLREQGARLLEMARNASTPEDWKAIWGIPKPPIAFGWGDCWKQCVAYRVDDFESEVGYYFDVIGLSLFAIGSDSVMFTSPDNAFLLAVMPASGDAPAAPPKSVRVEFMVQDFFATVKELENRGVAFDEVAQPWGADSPMQIGCFATPGGIEIKLWGMVEATPEAALEPASQPAIETAA